MPLSVPLNGRLVRPALHGFAAALPACPHLRPQAFQPPAAVSASVAAARTVGSPPAARIAQAIPSLRPRDEDLLRSHGISSTSDLERMHFDLHLGDAERTTQFLKNVVGILDDGAVRSMLQFLGADKEQLYPYSKDAVSRRPNNASAASVEATRYGSASTTSTPTYAEEGSFEELAQFERQVLDLLQNYPGLSLERLDGLMYMSGKEPKFTQGLGRLQLLLDAMISQGTVSFDNGQYRFVRRTPSYDRRARSTSPSSRDSSFSTGASSISLGNGSGRSPRASPSRSSNGRAPAPRPHDEPVDLSQFEARILDTLRRYEGLPLERLNNMLSMTPGEPRYEATAEQLEVYLRQMIGEGKIMVDRNVFKFNTFYKNSRARSPSASRRPPSPAPRMGDINSYEPAVVDLLQNYASLSLERLDSLLTSSPKAAGYRNSPRQLLQLLDRLVDEGRVIEQNGQYSFRPRTAAAARAKSPTASRTPSPGRRKSASTTPSHRMMDIAFYEPAVLDLLQTYSALTVERLDTLLTQSPKAPGYIRSPASLAGLLTNLEAQGRITNENGVYRYRSTGKTPKLARGKSPVPSSSWSRSADPTPASAVEAVKRALSQGLGRPSSPAPPEDWAAYESAITTMLGNYGALPLDRLHDMLKMSMVWPRYDRTPAQLSSYLASLVASGRLVVDNGLYRLEGTQGKARTPAIPDTSLPRDVTRYEGQVLSTLASYPGLSVERLTNMLRLSKSSAADLSEDTVAAFMSSLVSQGKVKYENGLYKVTAVASTEAARSQPLPASSVSSVPAVSRESITVLDRLGFPTQEGLTGYVPFVEVWNGRWAMVGIAASIPVELRTGSGTLEQLGFQGLPSMELFDVFLWGGVALIGLSSVVTGVRYAANRMDPREQQRWDRLLTGQTQPVDNPDRFDTPELQYVRRAEIVNGRAAMVGFLASLLMEALTGRGIVGQLVLYFKLLGLLGENSGF